MEKMGDRIRLSSGKGPDREGVVTAVTGSMVRVRWASGEETTVVPAPGTLTVLAPSGDQGPPAKRPGRAPTERAAAKRAAPKKAAAKGGAATATKSTTKKTTTSEKGAAKKTKGAKRSSR